ncbi:MAG TPA: hypothetical protein VGN86_10135 [Pyrinomonadaceae bacterium]|jgi:hypothetical protein|nr:hypothetical protein [Pyrinomonadaceae bacterium]
MLNSLRSKRKNKQVLPCYAALQSIPTRALPPELVEKEESEFCATQRETIERQLLEPDRLPRHDEPFFTTLVAKRGVITLELTGGRARCLPVFSTPVRGGDYVQTLLTDSSDVEYLCSSPQEFTKFLLDLRNVGVNTFTMDRCPRCDTFNAVDSDSITTTSRLLNLWAIFKATELSRANLYYEYAIELAKEGQLVVAREVVLETVGHVTMVDPRLHLLLGQLGIGLKDQKLVEEAQAFLEFLRMDRWKLKLDSIIASGIPDFEVPT